MTFLVSVNEFMTRDGFWDLFQLTGAIPLHHGRQPWLAVAVGGLWWLLAHILADQEVED